MTVCEICMQNADKLVSIVLKYVGGKEFRYLLCEICADDVLDYIDSACIERKNVRQTT